VFKLKRLIEGVQNNTVDRSSTKTNRKEYQGKMRYHKKQEKQITHCQSKKNHTLASKRKEAQKSWKDARKKKARRTQKEHQKLKTQTWPE
jgi:hypothetical protein